jgi:protein-disulfide isomerase
VSEPDANQRESWSDVIRRRRPGESAAAGARSARLRLLVAAAGVAILAVVAIVAITQLTGSKPANGAVHLEGVGTVTKLLKGIPQRDLELGDPRAPVVVTEFADLQCPICAAWARDVLPIVIDNYVRTGKVLLVFEGLHFLDGNFGTTDSEQLLRLALSAANQGHLWDAVDIIFHNQGQEGSRWATPALLSSIAQAIPGVDAQRLLAGRNAASINHWIATADEYATSLGVQGTPSFLFRKGRRQGLYPQYADAVTFGRLVSTVMKQ